MLLTFFEVCQHGFYYYVLLAIVKYSAYNLQGCKEDISSAVDQFGLSFGMSAIGLTIAQVNILQNIFMYFMLSQIIILVFTVIHCTYKVIEWKKSTYSPNASKIPKHKQ